MKLHAKPTIRTAKRNRICTEKVKEKEELKVRIAEELQEIAFEEGNIDTVWDEFKTRVTQAEKT